MRDDREKILKKIRALMQMTVENGATESEAMLAMSHANRLMIEHDVTCLDEESLSQDRYGARKRKTTGERKRRHEVSYLSVAVAHYWDCRAWRHEDNTQVFFGSAEDTLMAHQMLLMFYHAMENEWKAYWSKNKNGAKTHGKTMRTAFLAGMTSRLKARLMELKNQRSTATTGNALVAVKDNIVTERFKAYCRSVGWNLPDDFGRRGRAVKTTIKSDTAYEAGIAAGDRVKLQDVKELAKV